MPCFCPLVCSSLDSSGSGWAQSLSGFSLIPYHPLEKENQSQRVYHLGQRITSISREETTGRPWPLLTAAGLGTILSDPNKSSTLCTKRNPSPCSSFSRSKTFTVTFAKLKAYYLDLALAFTLYCYLSNAFPGICLSLVILPSFLTFHSPKAERSSRWS